MPRASYYHKNKEILANEQRKRRENKRIKQDPCQTFRAMMLGKIRRDPFFCDEHIRNGCIECAKFYHNLKKTEEPIEGARIWET